MSTNLTEKLSEEDFTDDHSKFVEVKTLRKKAEEDAQLLANRIALLKQEELKSLKKIEETRNKAKEILQKRAQQLEEQRQKDEERALKLEEERQKFEQNKFFKQQARNAKLMSKENLEKKVKTDAFEELELAMSRGGARNYSIEQNL